MVDTFEKKDGELIILKTRGNQVRINDMWYLRSDGERVLRSMGINAKLLPIKRRAKVVKANWR